MKKAFSSTVILLSLLLLTGCSDEVSKVVNTDGVKEVQKSEGIKYTYNKNKELVVVELRNSSTADQVTIMQEMLYEGYSLRAVDTTYSEMINYNQKSTIVIMYFETRA
ncbi:hypothetical protein [Streptococcus pluranimalium]